MTSSCIALHTVFPFPYAPLPLHKVKPLSPSRPLLFPSPSYLGNPPPAAKQDELVHSLFYCGEFTPGHPQNCHPTFLEVFHLRPRWDSWICRDPDGTSLQLTKQQCLDLVPSALTSCFAVPKPKVQPLFLEVILAKGHGQPPSALSIA